MGKGIYDGTGLRSLYDDAPEVKEPSSDPTEDDGGLSDEFVAWVADTSVADLRDAIDSGEADVESVVAAERDGKQRKTVLGWAEEE